MRKVFFIICFIFIVFIKGSESGTERMNNNISDKSSEVLAVYCNFLSQKKVFFGHQSVGSNILEGIKDIDADIPTVDLTIAETNIPADFNQPIFGHFKVGKNLDPFLKCDEFKIIMKSGIGEKVDFAFLKFCYIDITGITDIDKLFDYYVKTIRELQILYPKVRFIHLTVPITLSESTTGIKARIKRLLKKKFWGEDDNIRRNLFNQKILGNFGKEKSVFDLARFEATFLDGKVNVFKNNEMKYFSIVPAYTDDGEHLNGLGRKVIAEQLIEFLVSL